MKSLLVIIAILYAVSAHAEIFKWVDEKGTVHYGDKPIAGSQTIDVHQQKRSDKHFESPNSDSGEIELTREEKRQRISDMLEEDRLAKKEARKKKSEQRERKRERCNRLKDYQRRTQRASRMYQLDRDGNRVYMSDAQKSNTEQSVQKRIQKACN